jgi:hypothetical protein
MTNVDSVWILNTFARMRYDEMFLGKSDSQIIDKVKYWCSVGRGTVCKLLQNEGLYIDKRQGRLNQEKAVPDNMEPILRRELTLALEDGIPCTSRWFLDILQDYDLSVGTMALCRALKRWGIPYGQLKTAENRKLRKNVLGNFDEYVKKRKENAALPWTCLCRTKKCKYAKRKAIIYTD